MRKAGEQVRQQSKRKKSVKACKRATSPLESEQSSAAVHRLFPHHAAFGEGRAAPGKHLAVTLTTGRARCRIETRAVRARCRPGQDAPGRKLRAPSADPPCPFPFHAAKARKSMQRHAKEILFLAVAISSFSRIPPPQRPRVHLNNSSIAVYENGFAFKAGHAPFQSC
jgi:hypothetical protein